jgi:hypothetical protein
VLQKTSADFKDDDVERVFRDPELSRMLRRRNIALWEQLERRALRLNIITQLYQSGSPEKRFQR